MTRRPDSRDVAARALAPSVEALDTPLRSGALPPRPGPATERIGAYSDGTLTRRSGAASLDATRGDFTNFHAGCHGPVPLRGRRYSLDDLQPVHQIAGDHESSVPVLNGQDPQRHAVDQSAIQG